MNSCISLDELVSVVVHPAVAVVENVTPPPQGIVTVVVAPEPLALTQAPTKSNVVTVEESVLPSSLVVIVQEPHQAGGMYGILCKFGYS